MKRVFLYFVLVVFALAGVKAQDNIIDRVEWVVGDKAILRSDIEEAVKRG